MERGAEVSDVFHPDGGPLGDPASGPAPDHQSYGSFATFSDPDGNGWLLQEITARLPGRDRLGGDHVASTADLANAMRRAAAAHGEHEKRMGGEYDTNWPDWYATYMAAEQSGAELPTVTDYDVIVLGAGRARRALRRRAGRGRAARRRRRAGAGRRRVLLLGVHPVQDAAAPG